MGEKRTAKADVVLLTLAAIYVVPCALAYSLVTGRSFDNPLPLVGMLCAAGAGLALLTLLAQSSTFLADGELLFGWPAFLLATGLTAGGGFAMFWLLARILGSA